MKVQPARDGHAMGKALNYGFAVHEGLVTHSCLTSAPTEPYTGTKGCPIGQRGVGIGEL